MQYLTVLEKCQQAYNLLSAILQSKILKTKSLFHKFAIPLFSGYPWTKKEVIYTVYLSH